MYYSMLIIKIKHFYLNMSCALELNCTNAQDILRRPLCSPQNVTAVFYLYKLVFNAMCGLFSPLNRC